MRKIINFILALTIVFTNLTIVFAEDESFFEISSVEHTIMMQDDDSEMVTVMKFNTSDGILFGIITGDEGIIVNESGEELVAIEYYDDFYIEDRMSDPQYIREFTATINASDMANYYDTMWGSESTLPTVSYVITFTTPTISLSVALSAAVTAFARKGGALKQVLSETIKACIIQFYTSMVNGQTINLIAKVRDNISCGIIRKERVNSSNGYYGSVKVNWLDNPYDYSYPAACRYLREIY